MSLLPGYDPVDVSDLYTLRILFCEPEDKENSYLGAISPIFCLSLSYRIPSFLFACFML